MFQSARCATSACRSRRDCGRYVQHPEADSRHREEVHRDHGLDVIVEEGSPGLRWRLAMAHEILADAGLANIDAEFEQFTVNARCSPKRILATHLPNQLADFFRHRRPPRLAATDFPDPEHTEAPAAPSNHSVRFDDDQSRPPASPHRSQPCPQESIGQP